MTYHTPYCFSLHHGYTLLSITRLVPQISLRYFLTQTIAQLSLVLALLLCLSLAGPLGAQQDAPKKPFKLRGNVYEECGWPWRTELSNTSEVCVGTLKYCHEQFVKLYNENFSSARECLEFRNPPPSSLRPAELDALLSSPEASTTPYVSVDTAQGRIVRRNLRLHHIQRQI